MKAVEKNTNEIKKERSGSVPLALPGLPLPPPLASQIARLYRLLVVVLLLLFVNRALEVKATCL